MPRLADLFPIAPDSDGEQLVDALTALLIASHLPFGDTAAHPLALRIIGALGRYEEVGLGPTVARLT